jgi:solute:Na+ symporter, SSS family
MTESLIGPWDIVVILAALSALVGVGWTFRQRQTSTDEFFLGGRSIPWWAVGLSFVAAEVSAATLIAVPATVYRENCRYLQFFIGSAAARLVLASVFIPVFYRLRVTSIYEFLAVRFGSRTQTAATGFFFVTRLLGSAVRLMVACLAISTLLNVPLLPVILLFVVVTALYTGFGGMRAVVWTGVLQGFIILAAGLAAFVYLANRLDGAPELWRWADEGGRLSLIHWTPDPGKTWLSDPNLLWLAIMNGFFGSLAAFGTDQDFMQRLLAVDTREAAQRTMRWAIPVSLLTLLIYVGVGLGLYAFYAANPGTPPPTNLEKIFPYFVGHEMPDGLKGLVLAAVVLASIDSPLAALATSFVKDLYAPRRPNRMDIHYLKMGKRSLWVFGAVLALLAWWFGGFDKTLWLAFKIGGVTFGSLLGVFLLGLITDRGDDRLNVLAMLTSGAAMLFLLILSEKKVIGLGWSWLVIFGTLLTFCIGALKPGRGRA